MSTHIHERFRFTCVVNGERVDTLVDNYKTLLEVLREDLNLPGTKHGCELGECGACAVLLDGEPVLSCLTLAIESEGRSVTTVEGLVQDGRLHPLQEEFADRGAAQCGYCTPGILVTAKALLDREPHPTRERIREALAGNLCRCTGYHQIIEAVEAASLHREAPNVVRAPSVRASGEEPRAGAGVGPRADLKKEGAERTRQAPGAGAPGELKKDGPNRTKENQ
jgi:aerobic-type carbon monoxide dehydrogenase small subunit (CoxS/CutS family)